MNNTFKALSKAVVGFAPTLASMLLGPFAGQAVTALEGAFGLSAGAGPAAITQMVQTGAMTPEIMAAARAADQKHEEIMKQGDIDLAKINAAHSEAFAADDTADRASARDMQKSVHSPWPGILSGLTTVGIVGVVLAGVLGHAVPSDPVTLQCVGALIVGWTACLTYWVGGTRQGAISQNALADIAKAP